MDTKGLSLQGTKAPIWLWSELICKCADHATANVYELLTYMNCSPVLLAAAESAAEAPLPTRGGKRCTAMSVLRPTPCATQICCSVVARFMETMSSLNPGTSTAILLQLVAAGSPHPQPAEQSPQYHLPFEPRPVWCHLCACG